MTPEPEREDLLGLSIAPLTEELRERYNIGKSVEGVVITEVQAQQPRRAERREARRRDRRGDAGEGEAAAGREDAAAGGEEVGPEIGAAAAVRRQGRAPIRRRADELARRDAERRPAQGHPHRRADRERQIGGRARPRRNASAAPSSTPIPCRSIASFAVLTARPSEAEMLRAPHRLYGTVPASEAYSVGRWLEDAARAIARGGKRGAACRSSSAAPASISRRSPKGLPPVPDVPPEIRAHWRERKRRGSAPTASIASFKRAIPSWRQGSARAIPSASCARSK